MDDIYAHKKILKVFFFFLEKCTFESHFDNTAKLLELPLKKLTVSNAGGNYRTTGALHSLLVTVYNGAATLVVGP
jgi:hypothetical protein